jgi:hypothetical protein
VQQRGLDSAAHKFPAAAKDNNIITVADITSSVSINSITLLIYTSSNAGIACTIAAARHATARPIFIYPPHYENRVGISPVLQPNTMPA